MKISVVRSGYVGTTVAACLADIGHTVTNVDIDQTVVDATQQRNVTNFRAHLNELVATHSNDRLTATTE